MHRLAKAAATRTAAATAEIDLLRVHLETARYQLIAQYPAVNYTQLLNCMLLAATEGSVIGDQITANYHFAWFQNSIRYRPTNGLVRELTQVRAMDILSWCRGRTVARN